MNRRVWKHRAHLEKAIPALLAQDPKYELWFITAACEDSPDVNSSARAAVKGMRSLLKHPRLKGRVVTSFSVLEVAFKTSRQHPCAHVHSLVIAKPMSKGRHRLSEATWIDLWEESCPLARGRDPCVPRTRRNKNHPKPNLSIVADLVPRTGADLIKVIRYSTKWGSRERLIKNYRELLRAPDTFIARVQALIGVTRFFGSLRQKSKPATPNQPIRPTSQSAHFAQGCRSIVADAQTAFSA